MSKKNKSLQYWQNQPQNYSSAYSSKNSLFRKFVYRFLNARFQYIASLIKIDQDSTVVDLGCGSGVYLEYCARFTPKSLVGVDYSDLMISNVKEGLAKVRLIKAKAEASELPSDYADLILAIGLFDYLERPALVVAELDRILKPGGSAIITLPNKYSPFFFLRHYPGLYLRTALFKLPPIINWWSKKEALSLFKGFQIERIRLIQKTMWVFKVRKLSKI